MLDYVGAPPVPFAWMLHNTREQWTMWLVAVGMGCLPVTSVLLVGWWRGWRWWDDA